MGAFDDLIPKQRAAPQAANPFSDLVPQQPAAPAAQDPGREASLGERFMVNADVGFEGTLAGQAVENWMNEGNRYGAQAGTVQDVLRFMADQGLDAAPQTLPNPAQGGTPSPEGPDYLGAGVETTMPGRGTGDLAGMSAAALQERLAFLQEQQAQGQAEYEAERAPVLARREGIPSWYEEEGLGGKAAAGIAALLGQMVGGTGSPESALAFGRGASVLGRAGRGAAGGATGAGVAEPVVQEQEVRRGEREDTSMAEGAFNVALGGLLGGVLNVTPDMARGVRRLIAGRKGKTEEDVTPEDLQEFDPEELMRAAQEASDAATLDPEALETAIRTGTGQDARPRVGEGMAPVDARRARRDVERELGELFGHVNNRGEDVPGTTDVYRREDVTPGEEDLEVREGAEPLRDPTGEQANPESYGARSTAARTARDLGITLDENGIRLAARDIQADPQADPAAIVRSYSREERGRAFDRADVQRRRGEEYTRDREGRIADFEAQPEQVQERIRREYANRGIDPDGVANAFNRAARQGDMREVPDLREEQAAESRREYSRPAFEAAERRRQRREEDLATGENIDRQASTYRTAEQPYERQGQREVVLLDARRDGEGRLRAGESVEVLARAQRQTPNGKIEDMARIVRGDEDPVWVPASRLTEVQTPENPRMYSEALGETQEPPRGVMTGRGDSPEGFDASQTPEPRRAVDRQADPDGLRRGLYSEAEMEPGPEGPGPRAEETYDGRTGRPYREAETTEMTPQGEARTEFQGEGGEMPIIRTRRPVREGERPRPTPEQREAWEGEPEDPLAGSRVMSDDELAEMFDQAPDPDQDARIRQMVKEDLDSAESYGFDDAARRLEDVRDALRDPDTINRLPDDRRAAVQRELEMYARRVREEAQSPDGPRDVRTRHPDVYDDNIRREHQARADHEAAERREFKDDTGVSYAGDDVPYSSDQRTSRLGGAANEWYAGYLGREDLIKQDVGLRGVKETIENLKGEGLLSPTGRIDQDVLTNMDPTTRQRLFDTMDERRRRAEQVAATERESWQNRMGSTDRGLLHVIDHWRANNQGGRDTQTAQPRGETAQPATPQGQAVNANAPEGLDNPETAQVLRDSKADYGWAERGGNLIRDAQGKPKSRTQWLPHNAELMDALKNKKVTEDGYKTLVDRALDPEGKPLTDRQRNILEEVLEAIDPARRERAEAEAEADMDAQFGRPDEDFDLESQTEASRAAEEQQTRERADTQRRQRLNEEQRAQADRDRDDFTLTGSDRPADEAAARGQMDLTDQAAQPRDNKAQADTPRPSGGGTQLYSGIPLDLIAKAVKNAWAGERKGARETAERTGMLMESTKEALGGSRAKNRATKRSPLMDLWRVTLATLDGDLRTLAAKFNSPTLKSLPDMFHATAGRGDGVKQTFDEAVQARNNPRLQEVDRFMSRLRDAKLSSAEKQQQIIRLIENPKAARRGEAGKVAADIEKFLKAELDYLRKAGVEVGEVRDGYFPREMDSGKARANADGFIRAATRAYKEMGLRDADAKASAEAYWESTVYGASGKPGAKRNPGQTPSFVQSRVFSKAAAKHLDAYRVRDIDAVLSQYVMRATRRAEIARRFGDNWKDWGDIEAKIRKEDPDAQEILPMVRDRVALSAGVNLHSLSAGWQHGLSMARTWTTLATLPKAAMSSIGELVIAPWRGTTGNVPGDMGQHLVNIWAHMGNISRTMTGLGRSEQLQASFEMAEDIGIIAGTGHNSLMAARFAGGDPVGRVQSEVLAQFFRRNLLEGLTNYTRVTSMVQGQVFLRRLGKQMERHPSRTGVFLRELGVPRGEEAAFAKYVRGLGDDLPTAAAVTGPYAGAYRNALQRFTDQTVMRPSQSTRPKYASHPLGAVIFQLQAFGYAFQKNVLNRQARLLASKDLSYADKLAYSLSAATSAALLVGLQGLMRDTRDRLYDPDIRERKTPMAHLEGAVSQAGLLGVADPYLQSLTGIRYQRNPLASLMGPAASGLAESTFTATSLLLNNSENTNTAERNLADSMYDWLIEPAMQAALTPVSTGMPIFGKAATALTVYGIPKGRDYFTDALAGPRSDRKKPPIQGTIEWMMNGPPKASPGGRGSGRSGGRSGGRSSGRDGGR